MMKAGGSCSSSGVAPQSGGLGWFVFCVLFFSASGGFSSLVV